MSENFKKSVMELMNISEQTFDEIYAAPCFRGIRLNTNKADLSLIQKTFNFPL